MITGKKKITVVNVDTTQDPTTGDRSKVVTSGKKLVGTVELVGVQTAQLGQAQGFNLSYSVEVYRVHYDNQKYAYFGGDLYEIKSVSKAKDATKMLLHVQTFDDAKIKAAVEAWL